jgi:Na+/H+-dicarboxylate symporter
MLKNFFNRSFSAKIMLVILLGGPIGFLLKYLTSVYNFGVLSNLFDLASFGADLFVNALKMLVIPVIFASIVNATLSVTDVTILGRVSAKTIGIYLITSSIAFTIGIIVSKIVNYSVNNNMEDSSSYIAPKTKPIQEIFASIIPSNPIEAFITGNLAQVIVFALFFGVATCLAAKKSKPIVDIFKSLNAVIVKLVECVMLLAPYGVFCLIISSFKTFDLSDMGELLIYFLLVIVILMFQMLVTYSIILWVFTRLNPVIFFKKIKALLVLSFSTSSSTATIPISMDTVSKRCGVSRKIAAFTIPVGSTINMDGNAIMQGVATIFMSHLYHIHLTLHDYLLIVFSSTFAAVGISGIPGVGIVMLSTIFIPDAGLALLLSVDAILDMVKTSVNVTGDCMVSCVVAHSEGELDQSIFNDSKVDYNLAKIDLHNMNKTEYD